MRTRQQAGTGTIVGAVAGGAAGAARSAGTGNRAGGGCIGAVVGGIIGNQIGAGLDEEDRPHGRGTAEYQALEYGQAGAATPLEQSRSPSITARSCRASPIRRASQFCRPYTHTIYIGGQPQHGARHGLSSSRRHLANRRLAAQVQASAGLARN